MTRTIPFVGRIAPADETAWIAALDAALPEARVARLADLDDAQRAAAEVAIVANPDPADLRALPKLVWVQSLWAGVERLLTELDDDAFRIVRLEDPQLARSMAEAVLAWTLYLHRDMPAYARQQGERVWRQHPVPLPETVEVGLLGLGHLGQAATEPLVRHGFRVRGWSRTPKALTGVETFHGTDGLTALLAASDIVIVLLPLTPATHGLLDDGMLATMKRGARLINFARGPIVDTDALLARLSSGHLKHAVLDVFATEPLPTDDPCWTHPRVTVLPHISAPTTIETAARIVADNLREYVLSSTIPPSVDRRRGY